MGLWSDAWEGGDNVTVLGFDGQFPDSPPLHNNKLIHVAGNYSVLLARSCTKMWNWVFFYKHMTMAHICSVPKWFAFSALHSSSCENKWHAKHIVKQFSHFIVACGSTSRGASFKTQNNLILKKSFMSERIYVYFSQIISSINEFFSPSFISTSPSHCNSSPGFLYVQRKVWTRIAQVVEHLARNLEVRGSNSGPGSNFSLEFKPASWGIWVATGLQRLFRSTKLTMAGELDMLNKRHP